MLDTIHELHTKLNDLKKFETAYTSDNHNEMLIKHDGRVMKVTFEELGEGELIDYIDRL